MAGRTFFRARVIFVHIFYIIYSSFLWLLLLEVGNKFGHDATTIKIALVAWVIVFVFLQAILIYYAFKKEPARFLQFIWCNVPMLLFIIFTLPPYGYTLNHLYDVTDLKQSNLRNGTCLYGHNDLVPMADFITLQMAMPVLMITFILYPLPSRAYVLSEYLAIAVEFMNAFDIMDMIADVSFVRKYETIWLILFYLSMAVSTILLSFTIKIENEDLVWTRNVMVCAHSDLGGSMTSILDAPVVYETDSGKERARHISFGGEVIVKENFNKITNTTERKVSVFRETDLSNGESVDTAIENKKETNNNNNIDEDLVWKKFLKAILTMIFTDILFASIRLKIMIEENSAEHGFNMVIKNFILAGLHASYLAQHIKSLIIAKLDR